jgi:hypothetical protein
MDLVQKLKQIHTVTHPAKTRHSKAKISDEPEPTAEDLLEVLDDEEAEEQAEHSSS